MDIAVDFDGTLVSNCFPNIGDEIPGATAALKNMKALGCTLILFTCRCGEPLAEAVNWLEARGVTFDFVNENTEANLAEYENDSRKIHADLYIDDRGYGTVIDWQAIETYVGERVRDEKSKSNMTGGKMYRQSSKLTFTEGGGVESDGKKGLRHVAVVREGIARGHGFSVSAEFVTRLCELGNAAKNGVKVRYGHPNLCDSAPATLCGRMKNFVIDGKICYGDLIFTESAFVSPKGDLASSILALSKDPDLCGMSIVFEPETDKEGFPVTDPNPSDPENPYLRIASLHAVDIVDTPAATDGMFSANVQSFAEQASEWLDSNPKFVKMIRKNPDFIRAFLNKYLTHKDDDAMIKKKCEDPSDPEKKPEVQGVQMPKVKPPEVDEPKADDSAPDQEPEAVIEESPDKKKKEPEPTGETLAAVRGALKNLSAGLQGLTERLTAVETALKSGTDPVQYSLAGTTARKTLSRFRG